MSFSFGDTLRVTLFGQSTLRPSVPSSRVFRPEKPSTSTRSTDLWRGARRGKAPGNTSERSDISQGAFGLVGGSLRFPVLPSSKIATRVRRIPANTNDTPTCTCRLFAVFNTENGTITGRRPLLRADDSPFVLCRCRCLADPQAQGR